MKITVKTEWDLEDLIETLKRDFTLVERAQIASLLLEDSVNDRGYRSRSDDGGHEPATTLRDYRNRGSATQDVTMRLMRDRGRTRNRGIFKYEPPSTSREAVMGHEVRDEFKTPSLRSESVEYRNDRTINGPKDDEFIPRYQRPVRHLQPQPPQQTERRKLIDPNLPITVELIDLIRVLDSANRDLRLNAYFKGIPTHIEIVEDLNKCFMAAIQNKPFVNSVPVHAYIEQLWTSIEESILNNEFEYGASNDRISFCMDTIRHIVVSLRRYLIKVRLEDNESNKAIESMVADLKSLKCTKSRNFKQGTETWSSFTWHRADYKGISDIREIIKMHYSMFNESYQKLSLDGRLGKAENYDSWNISESSFVVSATTPPLILGATNKPNLFTVLSINEGVRNSEIEGRHIYARKNDLLIGFKELTEAMAYVKALPNK